MTTIHRITLVIIICILSSCAKEGIKMSNSVCNCTTQIQIHSKSEEVHTLLDKYVRKGLPGLSVFIHTPEGWWEGAAGYASIEHNIELEPCHLFSSASLMKPITAAAIMMLEEDGMLDLDDKISLYLDDKMNKEIANTGKITIRQLMNHTSGLKDCTSQMEFYYYIINERTKELTPEKIISFIYGKNAKKSPGDKFSYADTNYALLAYIIENITGMDHAQFIYENIIEPLNLPSAYYRFHEKSNIQDCLANFYYNRRYDKKIENHSDIQNDLTISQIGFAGMYATPTDYGMFMHALGTAQLISEASLIRLQEWVKPDSKYIYGLGLRKINTGYGYCIGHNGTGHAAQTFAYHFPESDITIAACTNIASGYQVELFREDFFNELVEVLFN